MRATLYPTCITYFFNFIFNSICVVERDTHPSGPPIRMGRVQVQRKDGAGTNVSVFFSPVPTGGEKEGAASCCQTTFL